MNQPTRLETFSHPSGFEVEIALPASAEELIDLSEFNRDERLPYWADLWPAARALTAYLLEREVPAGRVIELGSGVALPSLALSWRGARPLATDYYDDALAFARENARRNGLPELETLLLDWRDPPPSLGRFDLVIAADVLYEQRNAEALAALLPRMTAPGGEVLIADPGRVYAATLREAMAGAGWRVEEVERREEDSPVGPGGPKVTVTILSLRPPA